MVSLGYLYLGLQSQYCPGRNLIELQSRRDLRHFLLCSVFTWDYQAPDVLDLILEEYTERKKWSRTVEPFSCPQDEKW